MTLKIVVAVPGTAETLTGNWHTAARWHGLLSALGHDVHLAPVADRMSTHESADLLIALHARRSHELVAQVCRESPRCVVAVALTGTDVYEDLPRDASTRETLRLADRLIVLQEQAATELPVSCRDKVDVIYQSAQKNGEWTPPSDRFQAIVVANLRRAKDPLLLSRSLERLPESSRVHGVLVGAPSDESIAAEARRSNEQLPRFEWRGPLSAEGTREAMRQSSVVVITSRVEGSSNVLTEALVDGIPVISTRIPGIVGTLGDRYPGYFPVGDSASLSSLLLRLESDPDFYREVEGAAHSRSFLAEPSTETESWARFLQILFPNFGPPAVLDRA